MKKSLAALAMAGIMAISSPVMVMAEETDSAAVEVIESFDLSMMDEDLYDGVWQTSFGLFDLFVPSDWQTVVNVTEGEVPEDGIYYKAANDEETRSLVIYYTEGNATNFDEMEEVIRSNGIDQIKMVEINGIDVLAFKQDGDGSVMIGITVNDNQGGCYAITLFGMEDDSEFQSIAANILCSFSLPEEAAE